MFSRGKMLVDLARRKVEDEDNPNEQIDLLNIPDNLPSDSCYLSQLQGHTQSDTLIIPLDSLELCGITMLPRSDIRPLQEFVELTIPSGDSLNVVENIVEYQIEEMKNIQTGEGNISFTDVATNNRSSDSEYLPTDKEISGDSDSDRREVEEAEVAVVVKTPLATKRSRKRKAQPDTWKRNKRKIKRMSGMNYENRKNVTIPAKKPQHIDCSRCRFKCSDKISAERQSILHQEYWALADSDRQKAHLCFLVTEKNVLRHRKRNPDSKITKTKSRYYSLPVEVGENVRVCLKFFCSTFSVSFQVVDLALKQRGIGGAYVGSDRRKGKIPANITPIMARNHVKNHIDSFPRMESHYSRRDTTKLYLAPDLNISVMYQLYLETYCTDENITPVSINVYRSIFRSYEPQLSFHIPKKDQCSLCNCYYSATDTTDLEDNWKLHKQREKEAMDVKEKDKKEAKEDLSRRAISFDLEAILSVPFSADSQIYYKRKLSVFNFTIYDSFDQNGHCFVWDETHGSKGASEIATCLLKYLYGLPQTVFHVSSFSDTCGGQNRNQFVAAAMLYAVNKIDHLQTVDLKFMESGHSYLEADSIHATIERARKHKKIYTTEEWALLIEMARKKPRPYNVNRLFFSDVYDLQALASHIMINTKKSTCMSQVKWLQIKWLRFEKSKPFIIQYKYALSDEKFSEINVLQARKSKKNILWNTISLSQKYRKRLPISEKKKKDLLFLLQKQVIPNVYKSYIESLPSSKQISDRAAWVNLEDAEEDGDE